MEVILKEDIKGLGFKNDLIKVKSGYGRNYLIPQGFALEATSSNKKILAENLKQVAHKAEKIKTEAEQLAANIGEIVLEIKAKAGDSGKIFGSVTSNQISEALREKGFEVDRKKIALKGDVKVLGEYVASLALHKEIEKEVAFVVVAD